MKKPHVLLLITSILILGSMSFTHEKTHPNVKVHSYDDRSPCDAPLVGSGYTGSPGNTTCANAGCHSGTINSGPGSVSFMVEDGITEYSPGTDYTVTITMEQTGIDKFGFQTTSLRDSDDSFIGTNTLLDPARTRLITNGKYVATNACGSDADPTDFIEWTYQWTAPADDEGSITLYLATIATNHNHSGSGDNTYTTSLTLNSSANSIGGHSETSSFLRVYPNPCEGKFTIQAPDQYTQIYNVAGKLQTEFYGPDGDMTGFPAGLYFVKNGPGIAKLIIR